MLTIKQITENTDVVLRGLEKKHFKNAKESLLADAVAGAEGEDLPHMVAAGIETLRRRCGVPPETEGVSAALAILRETGEQVDIVPWEKAGVFPQTCD